ncbi:MAG: glutamate-cysteine ligase family protein [Thermoproteota archaeon]|nr:glutamate-cysteine ligase family protein [Thermoproteota archaeon]
MNSNFHDHNLASHSKIVKQALILKDRIHKDCEKYDEQFRIGIEIEICLLDSEAKTVNAQPLIEELKGKKYQVDNEYGSCQFEFRTPPTNMENIVELNRLFEQFIDYIDKIVQRVYKNKDVYPVFLGANPSPQILEEELITNKPRYKKLAKWQSKIPDVEIDGQKIKASQIPAAIQGFHLHLQGQNPSHTALLFNHILNIIPSAILLGANSKLLAGKIYSFHEPRIYLYDQSEQQNSGFPSVSKYLDGVEDYIDYMTSRESVLAKDYFALEKERHDDARIRLNTEFYRIETRVMSVQPTPKSLFALTEFFIGYLYRAISEERQLRPLAVLREERMAVIRSGYDAMSHFNIMDTIRSQLDFAKKACRIWV